MVPLTIAKDQKGICINIGPDMKVISQAPQAPSIGDMLKVEVYSFLHCGIDKDRQGFPYLSGCKGLLSACCHEGVPNPFFYKGPSVAADKGGGKGGSRLPPKFWGGTHR